MVSVMFNVALLFSLFDLWYFLMVDNYFPNCVHACYCLYLSVCNTLCKKNKRQIL